MLEARPIDLAEAVEQTDLQLVEHRVPALGQALDHVAVRALLALPVALRRQHLVDRLERLERARDELLRELLGLAKNASSARL